MLFRVLDASTAKSIVTSMKLLEKVALVLNLYNDVHHDETAENTSVAAAKLDAIIATVLSGSFDAFLVSNATELQDSLDVLRHYNDLRFSNSMRFIDEYLKLFPLVVREKFPQLVQIMRNSPVFTFAEFNHYFPEFLFGMPTDFFGFFVNQSFMQTQEDIEHDSDSSARIPASSLTIPQRHSVSVRVTAALMRLMLMDGKRDFPSEIQMAYKKIESLQSDPERLAEAMLAHHQLTEKFSGYKQMRVSIAVYVETQMQPSFIRFRAIGRSPLKRSRRLAL